MTTHYKTNLYPLDYTVTVSATSLSINYLDATGSPQALAANDTVDDNFTSSTPTAVTVKVHDGQDASTGGYYESTVTDSGGTWAHTTETGANGYSYKDVSVPSPNNSTTLSITISCNSLSQSQIIVIRRDGL